MRKSLMTVKELFQGDKVLRVPDYQRNYAWDSKQLEDLWEDVYYLDHGKRHYFGTLVLRETGQSVRSGLKSFSVFDIIDGQQRITSVLIFMKEILSQLGSLGDQKLKKQLADFIKDYLRSDGVYKLSLLGEDREFFENHVIEDEDFPAEHFTPSRRRLAYAASFFKDKLGAFDGDNGGDLKQVLVGLKEKIDRLEVMVYPVEDEADSVLIFETVNDRGKSLSDLDKTKSFLMYMLYLASPRKPRLELDKIQERFAHIFRYVEDIQTSNRGRDVKEDDVQRYHFAAFETPEKKYFYGSLSFIKDKCRRMYMDDKPRILEYIPEYARDLESAFFAVKQLTSYREKDKVNDLLNRLFGLGRVANFYPLLIACWSRFQGDKGIVSLLKALENFVVRAYVIRRRRADTGTSQFNSLAYQVHHGEISLTELVDELTDITDYYAPESKLEKYLREDDFYETRRSRDIKYLLFSYESFLRHRARERLSLNLRQILSPEFEVEHIWPANPKEPLTSEESAEHEAHKHRLGNLTLAAKSWNAGWGNEPYARKKGEYKGSDLRVQRELAERNGTEWRGDQIESREQSLVEFCLQEWSNAGLRKG
ncbi:MAG: DUF262 domain-containing protein [Candidatus Geothermarchaeales archaeon]